MGGDEVSFSCWNSTESITSWMKTQRSWEPTEDNFIQLWDLYQTQALERLDKVSSSRLPIIMWTSTLTQAKYVEKYLPKDRYIIQIWTTGYDPQVQHLLRSGYQLILSNYDALYLDCGVAGWVTDGNNWCSPYIGWQKVYDNSPLKIGGKCSPPTQHPAHLKPYLCSRHLLRSNPRSRSRFMDRASRQRLHRQQVMATRSRTGRKAVVRTQDLLERGGTQDAGPQGTNQEPRRCRGCAGTAVVSPERRKLSHRQSSAIGQRVLRLDARWVACIKATVKVLSS